MMTYNQRIRKISMHLLHELPQGTNLLRRPRILGLSRRIQPAFEAYPDRVTVMVHHMSTRLRDIPAVLDGPIATHVFMITDALPALGAMVLIDLRYGVMLVRHNPIAVQDNHCNLSHNDY